VAFSKRRADRVTSDRASRIFRVHSLKLSPDVVRLDSGPDARKDNVTWIDVRVRCSETGIPVENGTDRRLLLQVGGTKSKW